jgi:hypothetical protein
MHSRVAPPPQPNRRETRRSKRVPCEGLTQKRSVTTIMHVVEQVVCNTGMSPGVSNVQHQVISLPRNTLPTVLIF